MPQPEFSEVPILVNGDYVVMAEPLEVNLRSFRRTLIKAAEQSYAEGGLVRSQVFTIRMLSANPLMLKRLCNVCTEQVLAEKRANSIGEIDWESLLSFIKELLPIILELIKLLS